MKFEIDDIKKKAITSQVFSKTVLLKHIDPNIDGDYRTSFAFLNIPQLISANKAAPNAASSR